MQLVVIVVTLDLTIHTSPTVDLGIDTILCSGTSIDLDAGSETTQTEYKYNHIM